MNSNIKEKNKQIIDLVKNDTVLMKEYLKLSSEVDESSDELEMELNKMFNTYFLEIPIIKKIDNLGTNNILKKNISLFINKLSSDIISIYQDHLTQTVRNQIVKNTNNLNTSNKVFNYNVINEVEKYKTMYLDCLKAYLEICLHGENDEKLKLASLRNLYNYLESIFSETPIENISKSFALMNSFCETFDEEYYEFSFTRTFHKTEIELIRKHFLARATFKISDLDIDSDLFIPYIWFITLLDFRSLVYKRIGLLERTEEINLIPDNDEIENRFEFYSINSFDKDVKIAFLNELFNKLKGNNLILQLSTIESFIWVFGVGNSNNSHPIYWNGTNIQLAILIRYLEQGNLNASTKNDEHFIIKNNSKNRYKIIGNYFYDKSNSLVNPKSFKSTYAESSSDKVFGQSSRNEKYNKANVITDIFKQLFEIFPNITDKI